MEVNVNKPIFYEIKCKDIEDSVNNTLYPVYILSISAFKLYRGFIGALDEAYSS